MVNGLQQTPWTYRGVPVFLDERAHIPNVSFKPDKENASYVQIALDRATRPWPQDNLPTWTLDVSPGAFTPIAVPVTPQTKIIWALPRIGAGRLSPFVEFAPGEQPQTSQLTIHMTGTRQGAVILQLYPGEHMQPPVWMAGNKDTSIRYWREHAYVKTRRNIRPHSVRQRPPEWWSKGRL